MLTFLITPDALRVRLELSHVDLFHNDFDCFLNDFDCFLSCTGLLTSSGFFPLLLLPRLFCHVLIRPLLCLSLFTPTFLHHHTTYTALRLSTILLFTAFVFVCIIKLYFLLYPFYFIIYFLKNLLNFVYLFFYSRKSMPRRHPIHLSLIHI